MVVAALLIDAAGIAVVFVFIDACPLLFTLIGEVAAPF